MNDYRIGNTITYSPFGGGERTGTVVEKLSDIKNGRPGFTMTDGAGGDWWGYDDQIVRVGR